MKSSLTLVSSSDSAAKVEEQILPPEAPAASDMGDKKAHLKLVGPENQADFIKDAISTRPKRKPRRKKSEADGAAEKDETAVADSVKPPRKRAATTKPRPKKAPATTEADLPQSLESKVVLSSEQITAITSLINTIRKVAEAKACLLVDAVIADLGDEAPVELPEAFEGPANPLIASEFAHAVDEVMEGLKADLPPTAEVIIEDDMLSEALSKDEPLPYRSLGQLLVSKDNDPFELSEWTLLEKNFTSRWYDSKSEAMEGLHSVMLDTGLNYACETKLTSRFFSLGDYVFKRYSLSAVVGIYAEYQDCDDPEKSKAQDAHLDNIVVPDAQIAFDRVQTLHSAERKMQMKPESKLYDQCLKWFSVACCVALALGVLKVAFETGYF